MSTPSTTLTRLVRWRVRDWASCFLASRFPLDDEHDRYRASTPMQMPIRTMASGKKSSKTVLSRQRKCDSDGRRKRSSKQSDKAAVVVGVENGMTDDDSNWPQFEDEDYIVFCFKEDGALDVVKNGNSEASNCIEIVSTTVRPISRKLNYGENDKSIKKSEEEMLYGDTRDIYPINDGECIISSQKDEEGEGEVENIYLDAESVMGDNRMSEVINNSRIMVSTESSDSNHSDVSNGSFAFPVLGWEWSGSPVQMPKSEGLQLRKNKARCVGFQCCRF